jgi:phospholipid/cholesterol/gamma-HCH transport system ATP-binding protein
MPNPEESAVLKLENVTVRYDDVTALDQIDLSLAEGETCVILGAAGSGKTVLLKTALGLIRPDGGKVYLFGQDTSPMDEDDLRELRSRMGILFQEGGLFDSLTIEENVAYPLENQKSLRRPPDEIASRVREALRFVELEHTLQKVPSELSGGMRRRVGIARAVVTRPALVLYDSPTAGLDPITANTIIALIAKERDTRNTTTALATHRYQDGHLLANYRYNAKIDRLELVNGDGAAAVTRTRFVVLGDGRIVFEGSQSELERSADPYVAKFARFDRMKS